MRMKNMKKSIRFKRSQGLNFNNEEVPTLSKKKCQDEEGGVEKNYTMCTVVCKNWKIVCM